MKWQKELTHLPSRMLEPPDKLLELVESSLIGLARFAIRRPVGPRQDEQVNVLLFDKIEADQAAASDGEEADPERIATEIMRCISAEIEKRDAGGSYHVQAWTWKKKGGGTERGQQRLLRFSDPDDGAGLVESRSDDVEGAALRYLDAQNKHVLNILGEVRGVLKEIGAAMAAQSRFSDAVSGRLTDALVREKDAVKEAGRARVATLQVSAEAELERESLKQRGDFLEMIKPLVNTAVSEAGLGIAKKLRAGFSDKKRDKPNPLALTRALETPKAAVVSENTEPELYMLRTLLESLSVEQRAGLAGELGPSWGTLLAAERSSSSAQALELLAELELEQATVGRVVALLTGQQAALLGALRLAWERKPEPR